MYSLDRGNNMYLCFDSFKKCSNCHIEKDLISCDIHIINLRLFMVLYIYENSFVD